MNTQTTDEWVISWERGLDYVAHRNGVDWIKAPVPGRLHRRHAAQTKGIIRGDYVERCACGAMLTPYGWTKRER